MKEVPGKPLSKKAGVFDDFNKIHQPPKTMRFAGSTFYPRPKKIPPKKKVRVKESPENMFERGKPLRIG